MTGKPKKPAADPDIEQPSHPSQAPGEQGIPVNAPPDPDDPEPKPASDPNRKPDQEAYVPAA